MTNKPIVPDTVSNLDFAVVAEVLARHACNITDAAADLGVAASDLRRLMWANPPLQDAAFEVVEARLDLAEKNIAESLHSDDNRERLAASMFTLRNSARSRRRGWITSAGAPDLTVTAEQPRTITFRWAGEDPATDTIERDGRRIEVPRYGPSPIEGEVVKPPVLIEHVEPPAPAEPPPSPPQLPKWPGPGWPPPLVAHLYAPPPALQLRREPDREPESRLRARLSRGGYR
jgi:hypothetical protein